MPGFPFRALEVHSAYAWDYRWIRQALAFIRDQGLNALVLHRNDIVDQVVYPATFFGGSDAPRNIFERYQEIHRALYKYTPTRRSGPARSGTRRWWSGAWRSTNSKGRRG